MAKTLLDCGNCSPDFSSISKLVVENFGANVIQAHGAEDALEILRSQPIDLITVNRLLDRDSTEGMKVIEQIKSDPKLAATPIMMITNFEDHQALAMEAGCVRGFGKLAIGDPATVKLLAEYLAS